MHGHIEQDRPFPVHPPQFATFSPPLASQVTKHYQDLLHQSATEHLPASQVTKHHQDLLRHSATEHLPASQVTGKQQDRRR